MNAPVQVGSTLENAAGQAMRRSVAYLAGLQAPDGHWCGEIASGSTPESDYVLLQLWLYPPAAGVWTPETRPLVDKAARAILARQLPDGGFSIYPGGPSEVNASIKAYSALKLAGIRPEGAAMDALRRRILELGGIQAADSYLKIHLSLFGLHSRRECPSLPPEIVLLPSLFLHRMPSWGRAIAVPLALASARTALRPVPDGFTVDELRVPGACPTFSDGIAKWCERRPLPFVRRRAIAKSREWLLSRLEESGGPGAICPPLMYSIMALDALGFPPDHPVRARALRQLNSLLVDDGERFFFQPCSLPVRDTALAAYALSSCGSENSSDVCARAAGWLLAREVRCNAPGRRNEDSLDIDDIAIALLALAESGTQPACKPAVDWLLAMQPRDDSLTWWGRRFRLPGPAGETACPTYPDTTGRILEALAAHGVPSGHPAVRRGVEWLVRHQEADGSWFGRWGVAYIHGTCFSLRGLAAAGESDREAHILRAGEWLRSIQNADGGWGESCASYDNGAFTPAPSTASQTAWAILGLLAGGDTDSLSVRHGMEYLVRTQRADGSWDEDLATGTGFPGVLYMRNQIYKDCFPLLALAAYRKARTDSL